MLSTLLLAAQLLSADAPFPKILDDRLQLQLVAAAPDVVTPTGIAVDRQGRVLVIESHTHFPPKDYPGPKADRILLLEDFDPATGQARKIRTFYEGTTHTMGLAVYRDGSVFVATRMEVFRLWDKDGDGQAETREPICRLETPGNYPHNGLSGFAFDFAGNVYFGFGENLGAEYKLIGTDDKTLSGGGEGGNIYCCDPQGKNLRRVATGFWNPFHLCFDAFGRLFTVDNDPDSRPPCRLLHVVEGGDYGFRFRHGRKGVHPFTSWNGELPGTLPMVSGTGEAPSGMLAYESDNLPDEYRGDLLVTSWGDHRLERYRLKPRGASFSAEMTTVLLGDQNFRPVGIALAPDGSLYMSDWVDKSYQLHRKGRVWRLSAKKQAKPNRPEDPLEALTSSHGPWREAAAYKLTRDESLRLGASHPSDRVRSLAARAFVSNSPHFRAVEESRKKKYGTSQGDVAENMRAAEAVARLKPDLFESTAILLEDSAREMYLKLTLDEGRRIRSQRSEWFDQYRAAVRQDSELMMALDPVLPVISLNDSRTLTLLEIDPFLQSQLLHTTLWGVGPLPPDYKHVDEMVSAVREAYQSWSGKSPAAARLFAVAAARTNAPHIRTLIPELLNSSDEGVRLVTIIWIGEKNLKEHRHALENLLQKPGNSRRCLECILTSLEILDGKKPADYKTESPGEGYVLRLILNDDTIPAIRRFALRSIRPDHPALTVEVLTKLLASEDGELRLEAIRTLRQRPDSERWPQLREIAAGDKLATQERCEAILGLSPGNQDDRKLLFELTRSPAAEVADEALRALRGFDLSESEKQSLTELAGQLTPPRKELAERVLARNPPKDLPKPEDQTAWLARAIGDGNAQAGERIFFHLRVGGCFRCHEFAGRGYRIGPDLSTIGRSMTRERLVQSIVDPSREIAPQFTNWSILTHDGQVLTGIHVGDEVDGRMRFADQNGRAFHVHPNDIDQRRPSSQSIMPAGLADNLTAQELRDLLAFLVGSPTK